MSYERIDDSKQFDGKIRESHELRYQIAASFVEPGDVVLDAGCGTGYGRKILSTRGLTGGYIGIDKNPPDFDGSPFFKSDFEKAGDIFLPQFDVFVGLEIIEHLNDVGVYNFLTLARLATKCIVISTPIVPNANPFHKQNFNKDAIPAMFKPFPVWKHYSTLVQEDRYGIFIFKRV